MKIDHLRHILRVSPKGQVVLRKELRHDTGIKLGGFVEARKVSEGVILKPLSLSGEREKVEKLAEMVGKKIRKGRTSVDIIRDQRD